MTTDLFLPFPDSQAGNLLGLTNSELHSLVLSEDIDDSLMLRNTVDRRPAKSMIDLIDRRSYRLC